jgi:hypothetical protein
MTRPQTLTALLLATLCACATPPPSAAPWILLLDATHTDDWTSTPFGGEGDILTDDNQLILEMGSPMTGLHWTGDALPNNAPLPTTNYELEITATRLLGTDFFCGLTFPVADSHATLILGGWGGALTGISNINGLDASMNETTDFLSYDLGRAYTARIQVTPTHIKTWLDGKPLHSVDTRGKTINLRPEVLPSRPLGVAAFQCRAHIHHIALRPIE